MVPPPRPCTARNATTWVIDSQKPRRIEPAEKIDSPSNMNGRRPWTSLNLPTIGKASVAATMYDVAAQVYRSKPPTSAMMRGIVVAITVWLSAPRNMASTTQAIEAMA